MTTPGLDCPASAGTPTDAADGGSPIATLTRAVYVSAPWDERCRILEVLTQPLGLLPLFGLAHGVLARVLLRRGWRDGGSHCEDIREVPIEAVETLLDYLQQRGPEAFAGLGRVIAASPTLAEMGSGRQLLAHLTSEVSGAAKSARVG